MQRVKFQDYNCFIEFKQYNNNRTAIILRDEEDGCQVCTASVNLPDEQCEEDETFIKNWSENTGVLNTLIEAGIVEKVQRTANTGFVKADLVKILVKH